MSEYSDSLLKAIRDALTGGASVTINAGDIEIGGVELKDGTTDTRAKIAAATAIVTGDNAIAVHDAINEKSGREIRDTFARPADTTPYTIGDVIAATVSDTATTPMRPLALARAAGKPFMLTYLALRSDKTDFLPTMRVHFYTVADPAAAPNSGSALKGDNVAMVQTKNNIATRIGHVDFAAMAQGHAADDYAGAILDALRVVMVPDAASANVFYRLEIIAGTSITPASAQNFYLVARSVDI